MMTAKQVRGKRGESQALDYLRRQGMALVMRNYRCRGGELDLIMRDGANLVFVEVRARSSARFGGAAASVTAAKRRRMTIAAAHYLMIHRIDAPCRFDVVTLDGPGDDPVLNWIPAAFETS